MQKYAKPPGEWFCKDRMPSVCKKAVAVCKTVWLQQGFDGAE